MPSELQPLVIKLYPGVSRALGFMERAGGWLVLEACLNTVPCDSCSRAKCDEVSGHVCPSDPSTLMMNCHSSSDHTCVDERQPTSSPSSLGEAKKEQEEDEDAPARKHQRCAEEDVSARTCTCAAS